jgi:DUF2924 family protein
MFRFICWHIQEQAHGGVDANTAKLLDGLARGDKLGVNQRLKPGTVLVREGERHTVTVVPGGYLWRDATYASLSAIAFNITGTAWNGPRFFGRRAGGNRPEVIEGTPTGNHAGIAAVGRLRRSSVSAARTKVRRRSQATGRFSAARSTPPNRPSIISTSSSTHSMPSARPARPRCRPLRRWRRFGGFARAPCPASPVGRGQGPQDQYRDGLQS